ncbi:MAG: hypothetical protein HN948_05775, partial [Clostridia bacterium]|nr:hypothetical protein [Clostridia bacterium]
MRNTTVYPGSANGVVTAPSSLDEALSAIVLAAITRTSVRGAGSSVDTISMFNGLFAMGAKFRQQEDVVTFYTAPKKGSANIECTHKVLVFLLPLCIALGGEYTFLGEFDSHIIAGLKSLDIDWSVSEKGVTIRSNRQNRDTALEDETFAAGFMLTLPLNESAKLSCSSGKKFAELTVAIMQDFGYRLFDQEGYSIAKHRKVDTNYIYSVGGDYGKSAYLLLAGFLS